MALEDKVTLNSSSEVRVIVRANDPVGVPIECESGLLVIQTKGKWKINPLFDTECDADGYSIDTVKKDKNFPGEAYKAGRLIAYIIKEDDKGNPINLYYPIGTDSVSIYLTNQTFFLVCNDENYEDNSGEIEVICTLQLSDVT